jgi:chaperonin GroEL
MKKQFSLFEKININKAVIDNIVQCVKITLGPTGKNGILSTEKEPIKFLTNGSVLIKSLEFETNSENIILKLIEQACLKTKSVSGDGSTTTILLTCQLLQNSFRFLSNGYNSIFLSNGMKKIGHFLMEKVLSFSQPILEREQLVGIMKTALGKKVNNEVLTVLTKSIDEVGRDGLLLVEENISSETTLEVVQGIEIDKGFASSYFVTDLKNFEVVYENPYLLIANSPISSLNQIREIIEFIKLNNKPLVIVAEEITKDLISSLVLNTIQKKMKVVVIKYSSIKFLKNGLLEDLALLSHSNYFTSNLKTASNNVIFTVEDLGSVEKVIVKKQKSTFFVSKFAKVISKRRINELNREFLTSDSEHEKNILKTRMARLSGNITKIKLGISNQYEVDELRQKIETVIQTLKSSLEEGFVGGGGIFYLYLREELLNWSYLNLVGEELFASQIIADSFLRPFEELFNNTNISPYKVIEELRMLGYPYGYNVMDQKIVHTIKEGLIDSSKVVRSVLWNSISLVSTIITSE